MKADTRLSSKSRELHADARVRVRKLALIGAGKLGEGLLSGILGSQLIPASRVSATVAHQPRADYLSGKHGVEAHTSNRRAVSGWVSLTLTLSPTRRSKSRHNPSPFSGLGRAALQPRRADALKIVAESVGARSAAGL